MDKINGKEERERKRWDRWDPAEKESIEAISLARIRADFSTKARECAYILKCNAWRRWKLNL